MAFLASSFATSCFSCSFRAEGGRARGGGVGVGLEGGAEGEGKREGRGEGREGETTHLNRRRMNNASQRAYQTRTSSVVCCRALHAVLLCICRAQFQLIEPVSDRASNTIPYAISLHTMLHTRLDNHTQATCQTAHLCCKPCRRHPVSGIVSLTIRVVLASATQSNCILLLYWSCRTYLKWLHTI